LGKGETLGSRLQIFSKRRESCSSKRSKNSDEDRTAQEPEEYYDEAYYFNHFLDNDEEQENPDFQELLRLLYIKSMANLGLPIFQVKCFFFSEIASNQAVTTASGTTVTGG